MNFKKTKRLTISLLFLLGFVSYHPAFATESRTKTTTLQTQTILTSNDMCDGLGSPGDICLGTVQNGGITVNINGGLLNFNICGSGMDRDPLDLPCRVTPFIPPGADAQLGTGLDPIIFNDNGTTTSFGGPTNDPVPAGSSNIFLPNFLLHGPSPGEVTMTCASEATCGADVPSATFTIFQDFRSVPSGIAKVPAGALCTSARCNHVEMTMDHQMVGSNAGNTPFKIDFTIDSETDASGKLIPGTALGTYTITCSTGGCVSGTGTFSVTEPGGGLFPELKRFCQD
ncbi:hypothetical protein JYT87_01945 [Nitrospira defluvii]|nr:hypothetical protein [Nitrospira defluvii]